MKRSIILTLSIFALLLTWTPLLATDIVAHRGASHDAPENTMSSVLLAWEQDADLAEVDVHLTKDNEIVVIHDKDTKRTAGVKLKVKKSTLAELRQLDVGSWKDAKYAGERISTLAEVLPTIPAGKRLVVEIKCEGPIIEKLEEVLADSGVARAQVVVVSFNYDIVKSFKSRNPDMVVMWLKKIKKGWVTGKWRPSAEEIIQKAHAASLDGVDVKAVPSVNASFVRKVKEAGLQLYVYTVDDVDHAKALMRYGIDGLTTNCPALMKDIRSQVE